MSLFLAWEGQVAVLQSMPFHPASQIHWLFSASHRPWAGPVHSAGVDIRPVSLSVALPLTHSPSFNEKRGREY